MDDFAYYFDDNCTYRKKDGMKIANFTFEVKAVHKYVSDESYKFELDIEFISGGEHYRKVIDKRNLHKLDCFDISPNLFVSPSVNGAKEIAFAIMERIHYAPIQEVYSVTRIGWHNYQGNHFYCAGDNILSHQPINNVTVNANIANLSFEYDNTLNEKDALRAALNIIRIESTITPILFAGNLLGIIRQILIDAGIRDNIVIILVGSTHCQKTSVSKVVIFLYNRSDLDSGLQSTRMCSSLPAVEKKLTDMKDTSFLLDDLNESVQTSERNRQEAILHYVIREAGDNCGRSTMKATAQINSKVFMTAEYIPDLSISDLARTLIIKVNKPMANAQLTECQMHPLSLSTFYKYFIEWVSARYEDLVGDIKIHYEEHRKTSYRSSNKYKRLEDQAFLLEYIFGLFLRYAKEHIDIDDQGDKKQFKEILNNVIENQIYEIRKLELREQYRKNLSLAVLDMWNNQHIKDCGKNSSCFKKSNCLFITAEHLAETLLSTTGISLSAKSIVGYFRRRNFSGFYADGTTKKVNNTRYLTLNFAELHRDADRRC